MFNLSVLAGNPVRLTATARAGSAEVHRWRVRLLAADDLAPGATPRLSFASQIGRGDREQYIEIPAQDVDCRLEVTSSRRDGAGWSEQQSTPSTDAPGLTRLGYGALTAASEYDVLLSFQIGPGRAPERR